MKGNNFKEENDLTLAKKMLDRIISPLNKDEKTLLLKLLLELTQSL